MIPVPVIFVTNYNYLTNQSKDMLLDLQVPATCPCPEPGESISHP